MTLVVIERHQTDTWNAGPPVFCAVAKDEEAAKRWIKKETTEEPSGYQYAQGKSPEWWIDYGIFSVTEIEVFE